MLKILKSSLRIMAYRAPSELTTTIMIIKGRGCESGAEMGDLAKGRKSIREGKQNLLNKCQQMSTNVNKCR